MRRRAFLATCAAAGVAGCGSDRSASDGDAGPGAATTQPRTDTDADSTASATDTATTTRTSAGTAGSTSCPIATDTATAGTLFPGYETTDVEVTTPDGERLGSVTAAVADTGELRYTGLSDTDSLPTDWGMLFVYESVGDHTYVMREMDFGLDIVYADDEGAITQIHHAPAPGPDEDGEDQRYPGTGQYVLEVNQGWTTERGVGEGDLLRFDL